MSAPHSLRTPRRLLAVLVLLLAGVTWTYTTPNAAARTTASLVTCPVGTQTTAYSPGLKLPATPPATVSLSTGGSLGPCVSLDLNHTGASFSLTGSGQLSCLGGNSSGTGRLDWVNPGTSDSYFDFTGGISLRPDGVTVLVLTGEVTSGDYTGATVIETVVLASTDLTACLSPAGLTSVSGPFTVSLVGI